MLLNPGLTIPWSHKNVFWGKMPNPSLPQKAEILVCECTAQNKKEPPANECLPECDKRKVLSSDLKFDLNGLYKVNASSFAIY